MTVKLENMGAIIGWKHNHQAGMVTVDGEITEFPGGIPSDNDINTWKAEYDAHVVATAYQAKRRDAHAELEDQLDMQYWDAVNGTTTWKDYVASVKAAHPK